MAAAQREDVEKGRNKRGRPKRGGENGVCVCVCVCLCVFACVFVCVFLIFKFYFLFFSLMSIIFLNTLSNYCQN